MLAGEDRDVRSTHRARTSGSASGSAAKKDDAAPGADSTSPTSTSRATIPRDNRPASRVNSIEASTLTGGRGYVNAGVVQGSRCRVQGSELGGGNAIRVSSYDVHR